ncbi:hypothetical protein ABT299_36300 [Spirillospora sp. NPDC000708]|uniref:hypothetical protein n=1 Tax=Actinomadura sp. RB99 TaxID=2691577 RepID=UPI0016825DB7|nr:hypothetical protein [Actinomadura sp. RB99]
MSLPRLLAVLGFCSLLAVAVFGLWPTHIKVGVETESCGSVWFSRTPSDDHPAKNDPTGEVDLQRDVRCGEARDQVKRPGQVAAGVTVALFLAAAVAERRRSRSR